MDTATQQIENVRAADQRAADFDKALAVGHLVGVNWTASFVSYSGRARVLKLNAKSVVTELVAPIEDGRTKLYRVGERITVPRFTDGKRWSASNRVEPFPRLWGVLYEYRDDGPSTARIVSPLAYDPALRDLLSTSEIEEVPAEVSHCVALRAPRRPRPLLIVRERRCTTCYWTGLQSADIPRIEQRLGVVVNWEGFAATDMVSS